MSVSYLVSARSREVCELSPKNTQVFRLQWIIVFFWTQQFFYCWSHLWIQVPKPGIRLLCDSITSRETEIKRWDLTIIRGKRRTKIGIPNNISGVKEMYPVILQMISSNRILHNRDMNPGKRWGFLTIENLPRIFRWSLFVIDQKSSDIMIQFHYLYRFNCFMLSSYFILYQQS